MIRPKPRSILMVAGALSLVGAAVSGEVAVLHMRWMAAAYGAICGDQGLPHCAACPTAVGLLMAGLAFLAAAMKEPRAATVRSSAR